MSAPMPEHLTPPSGDNKALRRVGLCLLILLVCFALILYVDRSLTLYIRNQIDPQILSIFVEITKYGKAEYYIVPALLAFLIGRILFLRTAPRPACQFYHAIARVGLFVMASLAASAIVIHAIKITVGRARPKALLREDYYGFDFFAFDTSLNSFPSGHSQTVWAALIPLTIVFPKARAALIALAILIAASRVMVSAHYLSDVVAGSFIAILGALIVREKWFADVTPLHLPSKDPLDISQEQRSTQ